MSISEEERDAIVKYRLEKSNIAIQEAEKYLK